MSVLRVTNMGVLDRSLQPESREGMLKTMGAGVCPDPKSDRSIF